MGARGLEPQAMSSSPLTDVNLLFTLVGNGYGMGRLTATRGCLYTASCWASFDFGSLRAPSLIQAADRQIANKKDPVLYNWVLIN